MADEEVPAFLHNNKQAIDAMVIQLDRNMASGDNLDQDQELLEFNLDADGEEEEFEAELQHEARKQRLPAIGVSRARRNTYKAVPRAVSTIMGKASLAFIQKDRVETVRLSLQAIAMYPNFGDPYRHIGLCLEDVGNDRVALDFFFVAAHLDANNPDAWGQCAAIAARQRHIPYVIYCLKKMQRQVSAKEDPAGAISLWQQRYAAHVEDRDYITAGRCLEKIYGIQPTDDCLALVTEHYVGHRMQQQLARFLSGTLDHSFDAGRLNMLCEIYHGLGYHQSVERAVLGHMSGGLNCLPVELLVRLGVAYVHMSNWSGAAQAIHRLTPARAPVEDYADCYFELGTAALQAPNSATAALGEGLLAIVQGVPELTEAINLAIADRRVADPHPADPADIVGRYLSAVAADPTPAIAIRAANAAGRLGYLELCAFLLGDGDLGSALAATPDLLAMPGDIPCPLAAPPVNPTIATMVDLLRVLHLPAARSRLPIVLLRSLHALRPEWTSDGPGKGAFRLPLPRDVIPLISQLLPAAIEGRPLFMLIAEAVADLVRAGDGGTAIRLIGAVLDSKVMHLYPSVDVPAVTQNMMLLAVHVGVRSQGLHLQSVAEDLLRAHPASQRLWEHLVANESASTARKHYARAVFQTNEFGELALAAFAYLHRTFHTAVNTYLTSSARHPDDPMPPLMVGLCLLHLGTRRMEMSRHVAAVHGLHWLLRYTKLRGDNSYEAVYNMARALQYIGHTHLAHALYTSILTRRPSVVPTQHVRRVDVGSMNPADKAIKSMAAINTAYMLRSAGNRRRAAQLIRQHVTI